MTTLAELAPRLAILLDRQRVTRRSHNPARWKLPIPKTRYRRLVNPTDDEEPFVTLADLLALLRAADATPSSLAKMSPDPSFLPRRLWGADRWRAAVVAGVRQGE